MAVFIGFSFYREEQSRRSMHFKLNTRFSKRGRKLYRENKLKFRNFSDNFVSYICIYRVIKKSLSTWWLQYRKLQVMFKVSPAILQTFIDTPNCVLDDRVQYSTVHIPNVFCDGHLQIINCVGIVRIHWVRCTETFWSICINESSQCKISRNYIYMQWEPSSSMWTDGQARRS